MASATNGTEHTHLASAFLQRSLAAVEYAILHPREAATILARLHHELVRVYVDGDGGRSLLLEERDQQVKTRPELTYLACPYTRLDGQPEGIEQQRYEKATLAAAALVRAGKHVFSPVTHGHPLRVLASMPGDWSHWCEYCERMLLLCDSVSVLMLPGWENSIGVSAEIRLAKTAGRPVVFMSPIELIGPAESA